MPAVAKTLEAAESPTSNPIVLLPHPLCLGDNDYAYPSVNILNGLVHFNERLSLDNYNRYSLPHEIVDPILSEAVKTANSSTTNTISSISSARPFIAPSHTRHRSLVDPRAFYNEMTASSTQEPPSPPGLTDSRSSSFRSSSGDESTSNDTTHFEDISLDADYSNKDRIFYGRHNKGAVPIMSRGLRDDVPGGPFRELTLSDRRQSNPILHGQNQNPSGLGRNQGFLVPMARRSFTASSTPLARKAMSNHSRSRSPSPSAPQVIPMLPKSATVNVVSECAAMSPPLKTAPARRSSWQPNRKTAKELEKEYDDLDEDLPEDASLWNVPISPRPPMGENMVSPQKRSFGENPRQSVPLSPASPNPNMIVPNSPRGVSAGFPNGADFNTLGWAPNSVLKPKTPRGMSTGNLPDHFPFPKSRAKSWTVAMAELSDEAKDLTKALEMFADKSSRRMEDAVQRGNLPQRPSLDIKARSATSIELPPLRTNNVMIDPLPISKEKEKVMSRTRPSWLPPKSQKEEKRHLKEYQRMMELSFQAGTYSLHYEIINILGILGDIADPWGTLDKRKAANVASERCAKDDTKKTLQRLWEDHVLPDWDRVIREPRTRELWWKGVAPRSRAEVWERAIGNELALSNSTFEKALQRSRDVESRLSRAGEQDPCKERVWFEAIQRDIKLTFPELKIFQPGSPLHKDLADVLKAYCMYRSDVGYSHGTHVCLPPKCISALYQPQSHQSHSSLPPSSSSPSPPHPAPSSPSATC